MKHFFYLGSQIFNLPLDLYVVGLRRKLASFCLQASLYAMFISTVIFIASLLSRRLGHPRYQALWYFIQLAHFLFELFIYSPVYFIFFPFLMIIRWMLTRTESADKFTFAVRLFASKLLTPRALQDSRNEPLGWLLTLVLINNGDNSRSLCDDHLHGWWNFISVGDPFHRRKL